MIKIIGNETAINVGTLVRILDEMKQEFKISLELKLTAKINHHANILQFSATDTDGIYGSRLPKLSIKKGTPNMIKMIPSINGITNNGYMFISDTEIKLLEWTHIEVAQLQNPLGYNYTFSINGTQELNIVNSQPQTFYNVSCYVSNPWNNAQPGAW